MFNAISSLFKGDPNKVDDDGFTRLQRAVMKNDLSRVVSLIKSGADVNYRGSMIFPPLHLALDKDRHTIALALIQAGADINLKDARGSTPLHHAAVQSQDNFMSTLLQLGADPNLQDDHGRAPLHVLSTARPALIDTLVSYKANPNTQDQQGNTPLHLFLDRPVLVEHLLRNGSDPNVKNNKGETPFMMMLDDTRLQKFPNVLNGMLLSSADLNATNGLGETLLHLSARLDKNDTFNSISRKCDLSACDKQGNTVLHVLAYTQNTLMIGNALKIAPDLLQKKNRRGMTPLGELSHVANNHTFGRSADSVEAAGRLMLIHGAEANATDEHGRTLLHYAASHGRAEFAEYLLSKGADPDLLDAKGRSALHIAIAKKDINMIDRLLDLGANPDLTDSRGWTLLDRLAEKEDRDSPVVQRLIVGGGQYSKQLPLNPELMRARNDNQSHTADVIPIDKPSRSKIVPRPGAKPDGKFGNFKP